MTDSDVIGTDTFSAPIKRTRTVHPILYVPALALVLYATVVAVSWL